MPDLTREPPKHWSSGRCWCSKFHRDQVEPIELAAPPKIPGWPQFDLAAQAGAVN